MIAKLDGYAGGDFVALGLPRGGIPVAAAVAAVLDAPLDMFAVRKLGVPGYPELALGAVATGGVAARPGMPTASSASCAGANRHTGASGHPSTSPVARPC